MKAKPMNKPKPETRSIAITCSGTEFVDIDDLTPFQGKFKTLDKANYDKLRAQLIAVGVTAAATVWKDGKNLFLLDGHQRREALSRMKLEGFTVPPIPVNFATCRTRAEAKVKVLALASTYGTVNEEGLLDFAKEAGLSLASIAESFSFPDISIPQLMRSEGAAQMAAGGEGPGPSKPPKRPITKLGDLWKLGKHRLVCGDSTDPKTYAKLMGKDKATVVFTDPPYGVSLGDKNALLNKMNHDKPGARNEKAIQGDDLKPEALKVVLLAAFTEARKAMADDCAVFVCSPQGGGLGMMMMMMMMEAGLEVRHILNWIKNQPTFSMGRLDYDYQHEPILFTWTKTHKRKKEGAFQTSLWTVDKPRESKLHPTMKPVELPVSAILNHSDPGDLVLDIFGGSGTTLLAAERTDRQGRLVELDPGYCDVIVQRWEEATGKKAQRGA